MMGGMRMCCTRNTGRLAEYGLVEYLFGLPGQKNTHSMWFWLMMEKVVWSRYMRASSIPQATWETSGPTRSKRPDLGMKNVSHFIHLA